MIDVGNRLEAGAIEWRIDAKDAIAHLRKTDLTGFKVIVALAVAGAALGLPSYFVMYPSLPPGASN